MKQTNNWEEVDKIVESFFKNEITFGETKELLHQELTNLLKTVAEAKPGDLHLGKCLGDFDHCEACSRARGVDMWANNISKKYPEFINYLKK